MSFKNRCVGVGLTFDDVLLIPQKSNVIPREVKLTTNLTKNITLNVPILSSAMDTVTESHLAIALARVGGIGFIHKNISIQDQAHQVDLVKRNESGMIQDPITLSPTATLLDAEELLATYHISGLPIVDESNTLLGIITNRDLKYLTIDKTPVAEVMQKDELITAHPGISMEEAKKILWKNRVEKLPIIDEHNHLVGLITAKDIDNSKTYPNAAKDEKGRLRCGAAVGVSDDVLERVSALIKAGVDCICVDSAHGHSDGVIQTIAQIHKAYPTLDLIGGNIVTIDAAKDLLDAGCSAVKVGIGPGSICTTRVVAGVGVPQITAIDNVSDYVHSRGGYVIADGGIRYSGDIVKALATGADTVMLGSLFAGCTESPGEEVVYQGRRFKTYVGMGSLKSMKKGSKDRYFQTQVTDVSKLVPEGIEGRVAFKGPLCDTVYQLCGGIKSGMGYCGCKDIRTLQKEAKFIQITNAGLKESHPHDITITTEAPNYNTKQE